MNSELDDDSNTSVDLLTSSDSYNDEFAFAASDDITQDPEIDQNFDEKLDSEIEQANKIASEPEEIPILADEEIDSSDSSCGDSEADAEHIQQEDVIRPQIINVVPAGRGRLGKIAVDEHNKPLPPPRILNVKQEDYYTPKLKIASLPKRQPAAHATSPLIDFRANFSEISIIVDQDDSDKKGYQHACRRLAAHIPNLDIDLSKPQHDIWSFGLSLYRIDLRQSRLCNLLDLLPQEINNEENRPYWFMFKQRAKFQDSVISQKIPQKSELTKVPSVFIDRPIHSDLTYGALTSMNRFIAHKDYIIRKKTKWSFRFVDESFEIQTNVFERLNSNDTPKLTNVKYKIPVDIIDRAAIFHLWNDGFNLFLNTKGNVHEFYRDLKLKDRRNENEPLEAFKRQGIRNGKVMPLFSTIRLRLLLRDDEKINESLERAGTITSTMSSSEKDQALQKARADSLQQIREVFKYLLDFFDKNRIHVCFTPVYSKNISLDHLSTLENYRFLTFIQSYSWTMFRNINFRIQAHLYFSKKFITTLQEYSKFRYYQEENTSYIDDRFYRLCSYLHRRTSEYFFLDLDTEIEQGTRQYDEKHRRYKEKNLPIPKFDKLSLSTAYIPSVVLTPTTIKIRPLKLCKLNRVLREERFGGVYNFALIELRDEAQRLLFPSEFQSLKTQILKYLTDGFELIPGRIYKYLHHSQSQVKTKQFWFYYHDKDNHCLSHEDAYTWMGNFDKERVVAKHAARIALCFTSTDATIRIPAEKVTYVRDIKDEKGKYTFTDGVGTISAKLRNELQNFLGRRYKFSVLQIRYAGCKGTLSVDPRLDEEKYQVRIRDSMNKFTTDHDILELCKLSAARPLYLNRQDIVLLESRDVPDTHFLDLQNKDHLWLIRALLTPSIAYELLQEKLLPVFSLRKIARNIKIVGEQFFMKLIITCAFNIIRELLDRTRIRVSDKKARNMFGIVDEYGVLESGQVFIQYTKMRENKLYTTKEVEHEEEEDDDEEDQEREERERFLPVLIRGNVVITKNPCHHPGDLRVFEAVYHPELAHLVDVVVFPQKGTRPHSNEISGSDLDGDEYVVIWHEDLIPTTPNEEPYDYDSQEDPPKMERPITREDINKVVMEVSEQDCLGTLSNIHLAYADKEGIKSETCTKLAGSISQEVDAAKTGKHPLTIDDINKLRDGLDNKWPDFMKSRARREYYPSNRILGKLYRSARRSLNGWSQAITSYGNSHHINLALTLTSNSNLNERQMDVNANLSSLSQLSLDPYIHHNDWKKYQQEIKKLYVDYRNELLEIISLYRFQDEIDLFCRCEAMDASGGGGRGSLEDSAAIEVKNLIRRITGEFYVEFEQRRRQRGCCKTIYVEKLNRQRIIDCDECRDKKRAKAACTYIHSYQECNRLSVKSNRRILSFPWLFAKYLIKLRYLNGAKDAINPSDTIVSQACLLYLADLEPKFKVSISENSFGIITADLYYKKVEEKRTSLLPKLDEKVSVSLLRICFIEILNDWLIKQKIFGNTCKETESKPLVPESIWHELVLHFLLKKYQPNVRLSSILNHQSFLIDQNHEAMNKYSQEWTSIESQELQEMFCEMHELAVEHAKLTKLTIWSYLDEYIILALQCIAIEKKLVENWISPMK